MRELAQVYRALAVELDSWQAQNNTVHATDDSKAPVVYKLHKLVAKHRAESTTAGKDALRYQMKLLLSMLGSAVPTGFGFEQNEVVGLEKLMLDDTNFSILAPYAEPVANVQFW